MNNKSVVKPVGNASVVRFDQYAKRNDMTLQVLAKSILETNKNLIGSISKQNAIESKQAMLENEVKGFQHLAKHSDSELNVVKRSLINSRVLTSAFILMYGVTFAMVFRQPGAIIAGALGALLYYAGTDSKSI